jgi:hypothetical protein
MIIQCVWWGHTTPTAFRHHLGRGVAKEPKSYSRQDPIIIIMITNINHITS